MKITCPKCGHETSLVIGGRKRLDIPVNLVCDRIRDTPSAAAAAESLGCSKGYIFGLLKANGLKLKDVRINAGGPGSV